MSALEESAALGLPTDITEAVGRVREWVLRHEGPESDFTCFVRPIEAAAGVIVEGKPDERTSGEAAYGD